MEIKKYNITGGLYLVIDPCTAETVLLQQLQQALDGGVNIIQLLNNWHKGADRLRIVEQVCKIGERYGVPVIINEDWSLLNDSGLAGVHFDRIPAGYLQIKQQVRRAFIAGITCGNDLHNVHWAIGNNIDYISFCSMFPTSSAANCELVSSHIVQLARALTNMPIFLAGGITASNLMDLKDTGMNGVAVISGILKAADPASAATEYKRIISKITSS